MTTEINHIGLRIKHLRKSKKLSVKDFAELYSLNQANLYKWEKGTTPGVEDYKKLENILNNSSEIAVDSKIEPTLESIIEALGAQNSAVKTLLPGWRATNQR